jgi:hypothetical protein
VLGVFSHRRWHIVEGDVRQPRGQAASRAGGIRCRPAGHRRRRLRAGDLVRALFVGVVLSLGRLRSGRHSGPPLSREQCQTRLAARTPAGQRKAPEVRASHAGLNGVSVAMHETTREVGRGAAAACARDPSSSVGNDPTRKLSPSSEVGKRRWRQDCRKERVYPATPIIRNLAAVPRVS